MKMLVLMCFLSGCAMAPNSVRPEFEHLSHMTQHAPFTDHPTEYGSNVVNLIAHWNLPHSYLEVGEGYALNPYDPHTVSFGEIVGPREEFSLRVGMVIETKP